MNPLQRLALGLAVFLGIANLPAAQPAAQRGIQAVIRARPSPRSEIVGRINPNDPVTILAEVDAADPKPNEPRRWSKIALPKSAAVWVAASLVDPKSRAVKVDAANLRAGPGKNFAVLGTLPKGSKVSELRTQDGWMQIDPPPAATGFVPADALNNATAAAARPPAAARATQPPAPARTSPPVPLPARQPQRATLAPAGALVSTPAPTAVSPAVAAAPMPPSPTPAPAAIPEPAVSTAEARTPATVETVPAPNLYSSRPSIPAEAPSRAAEPPAGVTVTRRIVHREGTLIISLVPNGPAEFELKSMRAKEGSMNYVFTDDPKIELRGYQNKHVYVTGEEWVDARWPRKPLLSVQSISSID